MSLAIFAGFWLILAVFTKLAKNGQKLAKGCRFILLLQVLVSR